MHQNHCAVFIVFSDLEIQIAIVSTVYKVKHQAGRNQLSVEFNNIVFSDPVEDLSFNRLKKHLGDLFVAYFAIKTAFPDRRHILSKQRYFHV